MIVKRSYANVR